MLGWVGEHRGAGGTQQCFGVMCQSSSSFLPFTSPHSLSSGLAKDLHPKQGYPAWLEEIQLFSPPSHSTVIAACKHSCSPAGSGKGYLLFDTNRK